MINGEANRRLIRLINDAARRILRVKFSMGLFENPMANYSFVSHLGSQAHRDLAREAMIEWQGLENKNLTIGTTILNGISSAVDSSTRIVYSETLDAEFVKTNNFSYAVVVVGMPPYAESAGDNTNMTIPESGLNTIKNVCGVTKCVVVLISGRPLVVEPHLSSIDALVAAWLPESQGQGVADVFFGDYGFTGKLPRTWFDQLLINVGDERYDPLFPFGFGLTTNSTGSE